MQGDGHKKPHKTAVLLSLYEIRRYLHNALLQDINVMKGSGNWGRSPEKTDLKKQTVSVQGFNLFRSFP